MSIGLSLSLTYRELFNPCLCVVVSNCFFINIRAQSNAFGYAKKLVSFISSEHLCLATTTQRSIKPSRKRIMSSENYCYCLFKCSVVVHTHNNAYTIIVPTTDCIRRNATRNTTTKIYHLQTFSNLNNGDFRKHFYEK